MDRYKGVRVMNPATYIPIIYWIIVFVIFRKKRKAVILRKMIKNKKMKGNTEMKELAKKFIDKECLIYSFDGSRQYVGTIREVTDGAILIEREGMCEAVNLDFVIRIREYPLNKKGKKKSVVLD